MSTAFKALACNALLHYSKRREQEARLSC